MAKVRLGFVSNSSSSSFLIGSTTGKPVLHIEIDLTKYARYVIKTHADAIKYFEDDWSEDYWVLIEEKDERAVWISGQIEKGNVVFFGWASNDSYDDPVELYLYAQGENLYQTEID